MKGNRAVGVGLALIWMTIIGCGQSGLPSPLASSQAGGSPTLSANDGLATPSVSEAPSASARTNASLTTAYAAMLTPIASNPERKVPPVQLLPGDTATSDSSRTPTLVPVQTPTASAQEPQVIPTPTQEALRQSASQPPTATLSSVAPTPTVIAAITPTHTSTATAVPTPTATRTPVAAPTQTPIPACLPAAEPTLWLEVVSGEASFTVGEEISVRVCASGLVTGLAGFDLTISAQDGTIVELAAVELPKFGLQTSSPLPDSTVTLRAVDFADLIPKNTASALLATICVLAKSPGSTPLSITVKALDDNDGFPVSLNILQITLEVTAN